MKKLFSSIKVQRWMKRVSVAVVLLLLLLGLFVGTMVPLDALLFRHREGGVPVWLDRAQSPFYLWLNGHSVWAQRFFAWQSHRANLNATDVHPVTPLNIKESTLDPGSDLESRVGAIERYLANPEPHPRDELQQKLPKQ